MHRMKQNNITHISTLQKQKAASRFAKMESLYEFTGDFDIHVTFEILDPLVTDCIWKLVDAECKRHQLDPDGVFVYLYLQCESTTSKYNTYIAIDPAIGDQDPYLIPFALTRQEREQAITAYAHDLVGDMLKAYDILEG